MANVVDSIGPSHEDYSQNTRALVLRHAKAVGLASSGNDD